MKIGTITTRYARILLCASLVWFGAFQANGQQLLFGFASAAAADNDVAPAPEKLQQFAAEAIQELAKQETFTGWAQASPIIEPLGPGTHSWLVTLNSGTSGTPGPLGYLIISATPEGTYKLVEYGLGENSVFAKPALEAGLAELGISSKSRSSTGITPVYAGPALAEWMISATAKPGTVHFLDAVTGEVLPESTESWNRQAAKYRPPASAAGSGQPALNSEVTIRLADPFDPYDNILWMTEEAVRTTAGHINPILKALKTSSRLVFVASGPERTYSIPLPVYGYQTWKSDSVSSGDAPAVYILTGTDSAERWISLDALLNSGKFVAYKD
ncbi:hypothetical protein DFP94_102297 [Fontibacillus phaseoli]|uniref:Uncharacterized protein n=1 Tax=Fontibacillus phaseoli TaxID=1416533 RepID=A0A369BPF0_9BACL|nr:hypothetical protein [Fontibacillus phaseoli]RCX21544.1 hypothetical protein DFP94_102297 [Fontibacillus phaseoli]